MITSDAGIASVSYLSDKNLFSSTSSIAIHAGGKA